MEAGQILDRYRDFLLCEQYPDFRRETDEHGEHVLFIQPNTKKGEIRSGRTKAEQLLIDAEEEMALDDVDNLAPSKLSPESAISSGSGELNMSKVRTTSTGRPAIELQNATFTRSLLLDSMPAGTDSSQNPPNSSTSAMPFLSSSGNDTPVLSSISLSLPRGSHTLIFGPVGSGKSSLLSALLGELDCSTGSGAVRGTVAFLPQTPWILNATVEENIIFGHPFDPHKYQQVLKKCCLEPDLKIFPAGDQTEIGERGITLSGGQRVRVALARACYSTADIVLLDDPFASVDAHVEETLIKECVGELLKAKTVVCTTHHTGLMKYFDWGIELSGDGRIVRQGGVELFGDLVEKDEGEKEGEQNESQTHNENSTSRTLHPSLSLGPTPIPTASSSPHQSRPPVQSSQHNTTRSPLSSPTPSPTDTVAKGLSMKVYRFYLSAVPVVLLVSAVVVNVIAELCSLCEPYSLSFLTRFTSPEERSKQIKAFVVYVATQAVSLLLFFPRSASVLAASIRAALFIHELCITRLFSAPLSFFDVTPTGKLLAHFSKDLFSVDSNIPPAMVYQVVVVFSIASSLIGTVICVPFVILPLIPILILIYRTNKRQQPPTRHVRRFLASARTYQLHEMLQQYTGMSSIRAFGQVDVFEERHMQVLDKMAYGFFLLNAGNRRFEQRIELQTTLVVVAVCVLSVIGKAFGKSIAFLPIALNLCSTFVTSLSNQLRHLTFLENEMTSVERLEELSKIEQEPARYVFSTVETRGRDWPSAGRVEFEDVGVRYRPDLPLSLDKVSFTIPAGSKVGIVGRTGSGKSTLILALLRLVEMESGRIRIDGKDIQKEVGLHELRLGIGTTPQLPTLFEGSIRFNLDPFEEMKDDSRIWAALDEVGMGAFVRSHAEGLDWKVAEDGGNLSVGQQQLICLSRALLKNEKVILLDEATSSVDMEADQMIQRAIRTCFRNATVITVAHRLVTVGDADLIVVLERGRVVEVGSPAVLLRKEGSRFWEMGIASGEGDMAKLRAMAEEKERLGEGTGV
ncbi:Multidrug resistance-associated protein [Blattamonas nauphoetae]|uniref:Multidrug resistance-associated protein n=1 Tax=Blattamonas nauphoetae TaxID=2049346 RepID=A0ABQ9Y0M2_9EUKA|nr:Multidrug resistance-associated protein [Blattamonas nauphoetae]